MVALAQKTNVAAHKRGPRCVPPETHNGVFRTHQSENRLIKTESLASVPDTAKVRVENLYDYMGRRVRKTVSSDYSGGSYTTTNVTTFVYDGWNRVAATETTATDTNVTYFVNGLDLSGSLQGAGGVGGLLAVIEDDGGTYFPAFDGNGNVTEYVDTNGTIVAHREYDPFGGTIALTGDKKDDFTHWWSTKPLDQEVNLYDYGYRGYRSDLGRFDSRDPLGDEAFFKRHSRGKYGKEYQRLRDEARKHPYRFCDNSPITTIDPFGLQGRGMGFYIGRRCCLDCGLYFGRLQNDAQTAFNIGDTWARTLIRTRGGDASGHDLEALQHCIASGVLATLRGCACTECIGTAREDYQESRGLNRPRQAQRGRNNNRAGRTCGGCTGGNSEQGTPSRSTRQIVDCCVFGLNNGYLDTGP